MNYTRLNLIEWCKKENIKGISNKRKENIENIYKEKKIQKMTHESLDTKDPITLEPFQDWDLLELNSGIFMNNYYYKETTIKNLLQTKNNQEYKDPINGSKTIPKEILDKYSPPRDNKMEYQIFYLNFAYQNLNFYGVFLKSKFYIETELPFSDTVRTFFVGIIPSDIDYYNPNLKSLDLATTSDALLYRIIDLYDSGKLMKAIGNEKWQADIIKSLPKDPNEWLIGDSFIDIQKENSIYFQLIDELNNLE